MSSRRLPLIVLLALAVLVPASPGSTEELCLPKKGKGNLQAQLFNKGTQFGFNATLDMRAVCATVTP